MIALNEAGPFDPARWALEMGREMLRAQRNERTKETRDAAVNLIKPFYTSRAWRSARYLFLKTQTDRRCRCCGATAAQTRLVVDHVLSVREHWDRRLDPTNFQILCNDCNLGKGSRDATDFRSEGAL
jgi:5-methylcytosine-specific restriction endonuclease McrA